MQDPYLTLWWNGARAMFCEGPCQHGFISYSSDTLHPLQLATISNQPSTGNSSSISHDLFTPSGELPRHIRPVEHHLVADISACTRSGAAAAAALRESHPGGVPETVSSASNPDQKGAGR